MISANIVVVPNFPLTEGLYVVAFSYIWAISISTSLVF